MVSLHVGNSSSGGASSGKEPKKQPISARYLRQRQKGRWKYVLIAVIVEVAIAGGLFIWIALTSSEVQTLPKKMIERVQVQHPPKKPPPPKPPPPKVIPPKVMPQHPSPHPVTPHMPPIEPIPPLPAGAQAATSAPPPGPPSPPGAGIGFTTQVQQAIFLSAMSRYPPQEEQAGIGGSVTVEFVYYNGKVLSVRVIKRSQNAAITNAVVEAVREAQLPPPPANLKGRKYPMELTITLRPTS